MKTPTGPGLLLLTALLMFPQIAETMYSPALPSIAQSFAVSHAAAAQTLSLYFFAFAFGVVFWGNLCDRIGRRPCMLAGLSIYTLAALLAMLCSDFSVLLAARVISAFAAAVGSVATQTILRDRYQQPQALAAAFATLSIALALSPAIGMTLGALLTSAWAYHGVFAGLTVLAAALLLWSAAGLPETRPGLQPTQHPGQTLQQMLTDLHIWRAAGLIALFNISLFSYYQLAPFMFDRLGLSRAFGYSGLLLAFCSVLAAIVNRQLISRGWSSQSLIRLASWLGLAGGGLVMLLASSIWFLLPMLLVVLAFGLAIPNLLAGALVNYPHCKGTAGALLGLFYYLMLGSGLALAGWAQQLGLVLLACGLLSVALSRLTGLHEQRMRTA